MFLLCLFLTNTAVTHSDLTHIDTDHPKMRIHFEHFKTKVQIGFSSQSNYPRNLLEYF